MFVTGSWALFQRRQVPALSCDLDSTPKTKQRDHRRLHMLMGRVCGDDKVSTPNISGTSAQKARYESRLPCCFCFCVDAISPSITVCHPTSEPYSPTPLHTYSSPGPPVDAMPTLGPVQYFIVLILISSSTSTHMHRRFCGPVRR